jgi:hypothetical protein
LLVVATVIAGCGSGLLTALLSPLLATHSALPSILDDDVERRFLTAARCWVKLGHLVADDVLGGDATWLLSCVLDGVGRCLKGPYQWHVTRAASRYLSPCPVRVTVVFPLSIVLAMAWVLCTPLRLRAHLMGPPALDMWALLP